MTNRLGTPDIHSLIEHVNNELNGLDSMCEDDVFELLRDIGWLNAQAHKGLGSYRFERENEPIYKCKQNAIEKIAHYFYSNRIKVCLMHNDYGSERDIVYFLRSVGDYQLSFHVDRDIRNIIPEYGNIGKRISWNELKDAYKYNEEEAKAIIEEREKRNNIITLQRLKMYALFFEKLNNITKHWATRRKIGVERNIIFDVDWERDWKSSIYRQYNDCRYVIMPWSFEGKKRLAFDLQIRYGADREKVWEYVWEAAEDIKTKYSEKLVNIGITNISE